VLIFDEVKTGFRHALGGYSTMTGVSPDLVVYGKAIANGYPIAVIDVFRSPAPFCRAYTFAYYGLVVTDVDLAKHSLSYEQELRWNDAGPRIFDLVLGGRSRTISLRIAHSVGGNPRVELIEATPGTIWENADQTQAHHHCYWADNSEKLCLDIEMAGGKRLLGNHGDESGYFEFADASIIEILSAAAHHRLTAWIDG